MKLITSKNCPACERVKRMVNLERVRVLDIDEPDAMSEMLLNEIMSVPLLILDDGTTVVGANDIINTLRDE